MLVRPPPHTHTAPAPHFLFPSPSVPPCLPHVQGMDGMVRDPSHKKTSAFVIALGGKDYEARLLLMRFLIPHGGGGVDRGLVETVPPVLHTATRREVARTRLGCHHERVSALLRRRAGAFAAARGRPNLLVALLPLFIFWCLNPPHACTAGPCPPCPPPPPYACARPRPRTRASSTRRPRCARWRAATPICARRCPTRAPSRRSSRRSAAWTPTATTSSVRAPSHPAGRQQLGAGGRGAPATEAGDGGRLTAALFGDGGHGAGPERRRCVGPALLGTQRPLEVGYAPRPCRPCEAVASLILHPHLAPGILSSPLPAPQLGLGRP
jgi:hypothetical protein